MNAMQSLESRVLLSFGDLDPAFDTDGLSRIDGGGIDAFTSVKLLHDNRILAAGNSDGRGVLAMYTAQGELDASFGSGGIVHVSPAAITKVIDVELDEQGRILVAGQVKFFAGDDDDLFVSAYDVTGAPVAGYGTTGNGTTFFDFFGYELVGGIATTPDGGVVVGGSSASIVSTFAALKLDGNGLIDTSFGSYGYARPSIGTRARGTDIAVQDDGKIVIAGYTTKTNSDPYKYAVMRLDSTGALDSTFADGGRFIIESVPGESRASSVAIDGKGRIVVAGTARLEGSVDFAAVRILATGALDPAFSGDGIATFSLGYSDYAEDVSILPDGTIVLAGWSEPVAGGTRDTSIVRFRDNGTPDGRFSLDGGDRRHFGGHEQLFAVTTAVDGSIIGAGTADEDLALVRYRGYARISFGSGGRVVDIDSVEPVMLNGVARQPDGKIVAAGFVFNVPGGITGGFRIQRHLPDGSLDSSFGVGGMRDVDVAPTDNNDGAVDVAVAPDGTIYAIGSAYVDDAEHWLVLALDADGNHKTSFGAGGDGIVRFRPAGATFGTPAAVTVDRDGRVLIVGSITPPGQGDQDIALVRLLPSGSFDAGFGEGGVSILRLTDGTNQGYEIASDLALFADNSIAVAGSTNLFGGNMVVAVFDPTGNPDTSFAFTGRRILDDVPGNTRGSAIAIDVQQRIVVAGTSRQGTSPHTSLAVARLLRTGAFDNTFAGNGNDVVSLGESINTVRAMGVLPGGGVVVAGSSNVSGPGSNVLVARWNANGTRDTRFAATTPFATAAAASYDVAGREDYANALTVLPDGDVVIAGRSDFRGLLARFTSPTAAVAAEFVVDARTQRLLVQFNADVSASLSAADLIVANRGTGEIFSASVLAVSYDHATDRATVTFPGLAGGILPDGEYRLTLRRQDVHDSAGTPLADNLVYDFFFLNGDANRDGRVNLQDFNILAANFGQADRTFSQGDFNYDGAVNLQDFNILAAQFGTVLASPAATSGEVTAVDDGESREDDLTELM